MITNRRRLMATSTQTSPGRGWLERSRRRVDRSHHPRPAAFELDAGDVVFAPDGEEHWPGAAPDHFMTYLSITEGAPHWEPHVTDDEYRPSGREPRDR